MDKYEDNSELGEAIRLRRRTLHLTIAQLSVESKVSASHISRIEKGDRYPSLKSLNRIGKVLGYTEQEILSLAGLPEPTDNTFLETDNLDPYVAQKLRQEPLDVQRAALGILKLIKGMSKG